MRMLSEEGRCKVDSWNWDHGDGRAPDWRVRLEGVCKECLLDNPVGIWQTAVQRAEGSEAGPVESPGELKSKKD